MGDPNETDIAAEEWFNQFMPKLRYHQDYTICGGHSRSSENKIEISRPYVRLFITGVTKIYRIAVLGEELPDVEYTPEEEKELDAGILKAERKHAKDKGDGWE